MAEGVKADPRHVGLLRGRAQDPATDVLPTERLAVAGREDEVLVAGSRRLRPPAPKLGDQVAAPIAARSTNRGPSGFEALTAETLLPDPRFNYAISVKVRARSCRVSRSQPPWSSESPARAHRVPANAPLRA